MSKQAIRGMISPVVTPFVDDEIELELFKREVEYQQRSGVDAIGVAGSTGEGVSLSDDEVGLLVRAARDVLGGDIPVVAGVIRDSTRAALSCAKVAADAGADYLLVTPIHYAGGTVQENARYYSALSRAVETPLIIYNVVPANLVTPPQLAELCEIEGIVAIKQIDPGDLADMVARLGDRVSVLSAYDIALYSTYCAGAVGAVSALLSVVPDVCVRQWHAFHGGDHAEARRIQERMVPVVRSYAERPFPGKVKSLIAALGREVGVPREPLSPATGEDLRRIKDAIASAGLASEK